MKKFVLLLILSFCLILVSCNQPIVTTTTVTTKTTVSEPGSGGFILKKVIKGDTVWGYSQEVYGTGIEWRSIVAENPFLNEPGRIYYDQARAKWIVVIKPGETIKIGGKYISPTFVSEETTTTITTQPPTGLASIPWWGWLLIVAGVALLVWLFWFYRGNGASAFSSSSAAIHVDIRNGVDLGTRVTLLGREQDFRDHALNIVNRDGKKGRLRNFSILETPDIFAISAKYQKNQPVPKGSDEEKDKK